jgi:hypothetical protein
MVEPLACCLRGIEETGIASGDTTVLVGCGPIGLKFIRILAGLAPKIGDHISPEAREHYSKVKELLTAVGIPFTENAGLVRGLDYYTHTVFEFWDKSAGAQNAVGGGGRGGEGRVRAHPHGGGEIDSPK